MAARYSNRVLVLGAGSVSQCVLPLLIEHLVDAKQITIADMRDNRSRVSEAIAAGATYVQDQLTRENMDQFLSKYLSAGDFLLDLAWNIDANAIIGWAHDHGVIYLNTSVEEWEPYAAGASRNPTERTLYWRHMKLRKLTDTWGGKGATAIVEHGANPGLVSHLTKKALFDIATRAIKDGKVSGIEQVLADENFPVLAQKLGVKDVVYLNYRDGHLEPTIGLRKDIVRQIRIHKPDRMLIQSPERNWDRIPASHPDHLAAGEAAIQAVYPDARNPFAFQDLKNEEGLEPWRVKEVWLYAHHTPDHWVDITETFPRKIAALKAHVSQTAHNDELEKWFIVTGKQIGRAHV